MCFVIAKRFTRLNPDQALLTGLLHVLGRLYIIMRSKDAAELSDSEMSDVVDGWHATIGKAILESWGLPEALQHAVGMKGSRRIVAITKDPEAPILKLADLGVIGDLFQVLPALTEEVRRRTGR